MPTELEEELVKSGAILWEEFARTAVNKFDLRSIMSQQLGSFDTGLAILPPVDGLFKSSLLSDGLTTANTLDLSTLYVAIEQ